MPGSGAKVLEIRAGEAELLDAASSHRAGPGPARGVVERASADTAGLDEDGIVALFTSALRDFRDRQAGPGGRRGRPGDWPGVNDSEGEGVA
jgi:hypothetical protein